MAEAEDVITDVARHATVYAQALWRRHRPLPPGPPVLQLADVAQRIDLLLAAVLGHGFRLRPAQLPGPPTFLSRIFLLQEPPAQRKALAAHAGHQIWLPPTLCAVAGNAQAAERYRVLALLQAVRADRLADSPLAPPKNSLERLLFELLEAHAADHALLALLPGIAASLSRLRAEARASRPAAQSLPVPLRALDCLARALLAGEAGGPVDSAMALPQAASAAHKGDHTVAALTPLLMLPASVVQTLALARTLAPAFAWPAGARPPRRWLWRDLWLGEARIDLTRETDAAGADVQPDDPNAQAPRSARMPRRPEARAPVEDEDEDSPGAWMIQTAQPHEQAEDGMGVQRPTDRDASTAAEDFAEALSELPEARLVAALGKPKEVLISDDPPDAIARKALAQKTTAADAPSVLHYPEWDWRTSTYRRHGVSVHLSEADPGPPQWLDDTLRERRAMLQEVRRRFELLRARRVRIRRQLDGDEIDLDACVESRADFSAGLPLDARLYQSERRARRDLAVLVLVDVSGSTDGWIAPGRRVIDVEREALLMVSIALDGMGAPFCVQAFSGEGPRGVVVRSVKTFGEPYGPPAARRIAGLEPEHYTRAGAALRHAAQTLMQEPAENRLLLLLSDGKPNDIDDYEGRYGVEDMRQAVTEARLQGISPFCLTIDRQAAGYLPAVFGTHHYALLPRPELLPEVLLDWLRRLVAQ